MREMVMDELDELQAAFESIQSGGDEKSSGGSGGGGKYVPVPDGKGLVAVVKSGACEYTPGKAPCLKLNLYFPKHNTDETAHFYWDARNKKQLEINLRQLKKIGVEPRTAHPAELDRVAKSIVGWTLSVEKQTKPNPNGKPYRNYYLNSVVDKPKQTESIEDSIPF